MNTSLLITRDPIQESAEFQKRTASDRMGAVVCFSGLVRAQEGQAKIAALEYEAFQAMAEHQFRIIFKTIESRWPVESIRLIHRVGVVSVGESSLWVEVTAPHRGEAFAACQYLIDEMKKTVPIWKKPIA